MTSQPENKAEQKVSKDELTDNELAKVTGGDGNTTTSKPSVGEISVTKATDIATAKLF